eukprot:g61422.t1
MIKAVVSALLLLAGPALGNIPPQRTLQTNAHAPNLTQVAIEAYDYGYPLVVEATTALTMLLKENVTFNRFLHARYFQKPDFKEVLRPNLDTLYSSVFLDLSKGPLELSVPATKPDQYYLLDIMDAWSNMIATPGERTAGHEAQKYLIVGPREKTPVKGSGRYTSVIRMPSTLGWIIGRTLVTNNDLQAAWAVQDQYEIAQTQGVHAAMDLHIESGLLPASSDHSLRVFQGHENALAMMAWLKPQRQSEPLSPVEIVAKLSGTKFFSVLGLLMCQNPPLLPQDQDALARFQTIGFRPCRPYHAHSWNVNQAVDLAAKSAPERYVVIAAHFGVVRNGWRIITSGVGSFGADYARRACVSYYAIGMNLPEDAVYPSARRDVNGRPFAGGNNYTLTFAGDALPPVNAFWSITMYDTDGWLIENPSAPIQRYSLSSVNSLALYKETDGSTVLRVYFQPDAPGDAALADNWIPTMRGVDFELTLRLYWPAESALDGAYAPHVTPTAWLSRALGDWALTLSIRRVVNVVDSDSTGAVTARARTTAVMRTRNRIGKF